MTEEEIRSYITTWLDSQMQIKTNWIEHGRFNLDETSIDGICELNNDRELHISNTVMKLIEQYCTKDGIVNYPTFFGNTVFMGDKMKMIKHKFIYRGWDIYSIEMVKEV